MFYVWCSLTLATAVAKSDLFLYAHNQSGIIWKDYIYIYSIIIIDNK